LTTREYKYRRKLAETNRITRRNADRARSGVHSELYTRRSITRMMGTLNPTNSLHYEQNYARSQSHQSGTDCLMRWLQLRFDFDSTVVRRPFVRLSKVIEITAMWPDSRSYADRCPVEAAVQQPGRSSDGRRAGALPSNGCRMEVRSQSIQRRINHRLSLQLRPVSMVNTIRFCSGQAATSLRVIYAWCKPAIEWPINWLIDWLITTEVRPALVFVMQSHIVLPSPSGRYSRWFWDRMKSVSWVKPAISSGSCSSLFSDTSNWVRFFRFPSALTPPHTHITQTELHKRWSRHQWNLTLILYSELNSAIQGRRSWQWRI